MKKLVAICLIAIGSLTTLSFNAFSENENIQQAEQTTLLSQQPCNPVPCNPEPCDTTCNPVPCNPAPCNPAPCNPAPCTPGC